MPRQSETVLCTAIARTARASGFKVDPEVLLDTQNGGRAPVDMVCTRPEDRLTVTVEVKPALSWVLLAQAERWVGMATYSLAVCPWPPKQEVRDPALRAFAGLGVGLAFFPFGRPFHQVLEELPVRPAGRGVVEEFLHERHEHYAQPGGAGQRRWTPRREWLDQVERYVNANPRCTLRDVARSVQHPCRTDHIARNQILKAIERGGLHVAIESDCGVSTLVPKD